MFEGVERKTLVHGAKTILCKFVLEKGTTLPLHRHPHEQTGHLLSGKILFTIEGSQQEIGPGDSWCIGENIEHGVEVLEKAVLLELFSPVRQDYLD